MISSKIIRSYSRYLISSSAPRTQLVSSFSLRATREEHLKNLKTKEFDVVVVGGGCTGSGIALDAASRGLKVAMIEKDDFGAGTSSRSTKLLWAGSRYLVQALVKYFSPSTLLSPISKTQEFLAEFKMVMNCHKERKFLLTNHKHLTWWLPIAVPMDKWFLWPPPFGYPLASLGSFGLFSAFFKFYDLLGEFASPPSHIMTKARTLRKFPQLDDRVKFCVVFYEGQHNDSRTNTAIAVTAADHGATIANHVSVVGLIKDKNDSANPHPDHVYGVYCQDNLNTGSSVDGGKERTNVFEVRGKVTIFCGGPLTDNLRSLESYESSSTEEESRAVGNNEEFVRAVQGASGTHIVLPSYLAPSHMGLVDMATSDGRFLFFLPWLGKTLVGTTDVACPSPSLRPRPTEEEIQWLVDEASKYMVFPVRRSDVLSAWSGIRPLAVDPHASSSGESGGTASMSRDHVVSVDPKSGVMFVAGGKWTTYREMAEDAVDKAVEIIQSSSSSSSSLQKLQGCSTLSIPLTGSQGFSRSSTVSLQREFGPGLSAEVALHLARTYGSDAASVLNITKGNKTTEEKGIMDSRVDVHEAGQVRKEEGYKSCRKVGTLLVDGFPYLEEEILWAIRNEYACTATDILGQRTRLAYLDKQAAMSAIPKVVDVMRRELGWSDSKCNEEMAESFSFLGTFGGPIPIEETSYVLSFSTIEREVEEEESATMSLSDDALTQVFASIDIDQSGGLGMDELISAVRLLGVSDELRSDQEVTTYLEKAFPQLKGNQNEETNNHTDSSHVVDKRHVVDIDEFKHWWRSTSTLDPTAKALRKKLFAKYAVTTKKLKGQTGVAFG